MANWIWEKKVGKEHLSFKEFLKTDLFGWARTVHHSFCKNVPHWICIFCPHFSNQIPGISTWFPSSWMSWPRSHPGVPLELSNSHVELCPNSHRMAWTVWQQTQRINLQEDQSKILVVLWQSLWPHHPLQVLDIQTCHQRMLSHEVLLCIIWWQGFPEWNG